MKAWEIMKEENVGKRYKDNKCGEYVISSGYDRFYLELLKDNMHYTCMFSSRLLELDFEEITDWSKVAVDTKILVKDREMDPWVHRHFAKYKNGEVYAWLGGKTSFTTKHDISCEYAKLYEEGEE